METTQINTRFMRANRTEDVFDFLAEHYSMAEICADEISYSEALFSNGFIHACENGKMPILGSHDDTSCIKGADEYHHLIYDDKCYVVFFKCFSNE